MTDHSDVLIIGAGFSGIGAAYRIHEKNPNLSYTILERRERLGGTWDLFRYPGIRSDSDIFTLSFPWEPWTRPEMIADGGDIWQYMADTARKHGIDEHIRFNTHVISADWDSATDTWTVQTEQGGEPRTYRGRFLFFASGYYNYDEPYSPTFPGIEDFKGDVVHPQQWPDGFDYAGKRLVVIGSGATAVSMIPSLTERAAHVTMLQRTPSYMMSLQRVPPVLNGIRKVLPRRVSHWIARSFMALFGSLIWLVARRAPGFSKRLLRGIAEKNLPAGYDIDTHFTPPYNPWDQRLCFILGGDLYQAVAAGDVEMVTDHIDHVDATGIALKLRQAPRRRRDHHRDRYPVAGAGRSHGQHRRREDQPARAVRLPASPSRRCAQRGMVLRLLERIMDAGCRHDGTLVREAVGLHGFPWLHTRLPTSRGRPHARAARVQPSIGLCAALTECASEVGCPKAVGSDAQLSAGRAGQPV